MRLDLRFILPGAGRPDRAARRGRSPAARRDRARRATTRRSSRSTRSCGGAGEFARGGPRDAPAMGRHARRRADPDARDRRSRRDRRGDLRRVWRSGRSRHTSPTSPSRSGPGPPSCSTSSGSGTPPPDLRPRWARPGWHRRASDWMHAAAADAGRPLTASRGPSSCAGSPPCSWRPTAEADIFLKAVFPIFHAEPVITNLLADRLPATCPRVVAVEQDEGWLLVEDIGSRWIGSLPEAERPAALGRAPGRWSRSSGPWPTGPMTSRACSPPGRRIGGSPRSRAPSPRRWHRSGRTGAVHRADARGPGGGRGPGRRRDRTAGRA